MNEPQPALDQAAPDLPTPIQDAHLAACAEQRQTVIRQILAATAATERELRGPHFVWD